MGEQGQRNFVFVPNSTGGGKKNVKVVLCGSIYDTLLCYLCAVVLANLFFLSPKTKTHMKTLCKLTFELLGWNLADVFSGPMEADCHDGVQASV